MCVSSPSMPPAPPPPPPAPAAPEKTQQAPQKPPGLEESQRLAARLGTSALALPLASSINVPLRS